MHRKLLVPIEICWNKRIFIYFYLFLSALCWRCRRPWRPPSSGPSSSPAPCSHPSTSRTFRPTGPSSTCSSGKDSRLQRLLFWLKNHVGKWEQGLPFLHFFYKILYNFLTIFVDIYTCHFSWSVINSSGCGSGYHFLKLFLVFFYILNWKRMNRKYFLSSC